MNQIDASAKIHSNVVLGDFNRIGKNVVIDIIGDNKDATAVIGDNNIINDNTRIFIRGEFRLGDWNVLHNDMLVMAEDHLLIGHNCWFGQNTILDGAGGLEIGNGVRVGMYSQIWTHVASGELIEGCTLFAKRETIIEDDVWLVGSCVVGSGIRLGYRSIALINSILTKDTLANRVYAGSPAKIMEKANFYQPISLDEKFEMLATWIKEFVALQEEPIDLVVELDHITIKASNSKESVVFFKTKPKELQNSQSAFFLSDKTYIKTNTELQRKVYKYLYNNKARFLPVL